MKKKFYRNIILSKTPLTSNFRFEDYFQIYPCDLKDAPKSKHGYDIPLIIEFWIDEDENPEVDKEWYGLEEYVAEAANHTNRLYRLTRILSSVTNHRIFFNEGTESKWGMALPEEVTDKNKEEINNQSSKIFMDLFYYPTIAKDMMISDFTKQQHKAPTLIPHSDYFLDNPVDDTKKQITFPDTIYGILNNYYSLDHKSTKIVDTIAHLICNGIDLSLKMKSLSFLSFVSAIETLVNFEYKNVKDNVQFDCADCQTLTSSPINCAKCGRPIWGVKAKFKTFLKTYVSDNEESIKKYNRIYNLRSDIVHNGLLLLGDEQLSWKNSEKEDSQLMIHLETRQLARLALINWLLMGPNKAPLNRS